MPDPSTEDAANEQAVNAVYSGILRWLDRPENAQMKEAFTRNPAWAVYQQCIDEDLFDQMDVWKWLMGSEFQMTVPTGVIQLWGAAIDRVIDKLCLPDND